MLSLDPSRAADAVTQSVLSNFYEGLVAFDADMRVVPALAVSWMTPDERVWVFRLRAGVRFHDGSPLRAEDVAFSLERARHDPASRLKGQLASLQEARVLGERELQILTSRPDPLLLNRLAYVLIGPRARAERLAEHPVGTGPYRFTGRQGDSIEAEAFGGHWGGAQPIEQVRFVSVEDGAARVRELRAGRADVLRFVPPAEAAALARLPGLRLARRPGLTSVYLWLDSRAEGAAARRPLADRRVRRALTLAIDRTRLAEALEGTASAAGQLVARGVAGHDPQLAQPPFDPAAARRLLAQAGHPRGFETTLAFAQAAPAEARVAELVRQMLAEVGVRVRLEALDWPDLVTAWERARLPFFLAGWRFENGDALGFYQDCLHSRDVARGLGSFNPGFADRALDALVEQNGSARSHDQRRRSYADLARRAAEELPLVPLYSQQDLYAVSRSVRWQPRLDSKLLVREMSLEPLNVRPGAWARLLGGSPASEPVQRW